MLGAHRLAARAIVMTVACILGAGALSAAGQASPATPARLNAVEQKTRDAVLARFRALSIQNGIVLVPLSKVDGVESIEIRGGTIAVNGRAVTGGEIRERLGRERPEEPPEVGGGRRCTVRLSERTHVDEHSRPRRRLSSGTGSEPHGARRGPRPRNSSRRNWRTTMSASARGCWLKYSMPATISSAAPSPCTLTG